MSIDRYGNGQWGAGELDAEALAKKYGLDRSQEGRGDGYVWGTKEDGTEVFIGKTNMGLATNKDLIAAHSKQAHPDEVNHAGVPDNLSSWGDIKGALLNEWNRGSGSKPTEPAAPELPTAYSEKLVTARSRVKQYEEDVLGGRSVYGDKAREQQEDGTSFLSRYMDKLDQTYQEIEDGRYVNRKDQAKYEKDKEEYDQQYGGLK